MTLNLISFEKDDKMQNVFSILFKPLSIMDTADMITFFTGQSVKNYNVVKLVDVCHKYWMELLTHPLSCVKVSYIYFYLPEVAVFERVELGRRQIYTSILIGSGDALVIDKSITL